MNSKKSGRIREARRNNLLKVTEIMNMISKTIGISTKVIEFCIYFISILYISSIINIKLSYEGPRD